MLHGVELYYTLLPSKSVRVSTDFVFYSGPNLPFTGTNNGDKVTLALQKIELKLYPPAIVNAVISAINSDPELRSQLCASLGGCI